MFGIGASACASYIDVDQREYEVLSEDGKQKMTNFDGN